MYVFSRQVQGKVHEYESDDVAKTTPRGQAEPGPGDEIE